MSTAAATADMQLTLRVKDQSATRQVKSFKSQLATLTKTVAAVTAGLTAIAAVRFGYTAIKESRALEEQMKTIQALSQMGLKEFQNFERITRQTARGIGSLTASQFAAIEQQAVVLGISTKNAGKDIIQFARDVGYGAIALSAFRRDTELLSIHLAKQLQIFGDAPKAVNKYMSAIFALETTTAANALQISTFNQQLGASAKMMSLSQSEASAWGATLIAAGMDASNAATRVSSAHRIFIQHLSSGKRNSLDAAIEAIRGASLSTRCETLLMLESITGMSTGTKDLGKIIKIALGKDAAKTFQALGISLGNMTDKTRQSELAINMFGAVGSKALQMLAINSDTLAQNLANANDAFERGQRIQEAYNVVASSSSEVLKVFSSIINDIQLQIGGPLLSAMAKFTQIALNDEKAGLAIMLSNWFTRSKSVQSIFTILPKSAEQFAYWFRQAVVSGIKATWDFIEAVQTLWQAFSDQIAWRDIEYIFDTLSISIQRVLETLESYTGTIPLFTILTSLAHLAGFVADEFLHTALIITDAFNLITSNLHFITIWQQPFSSLTHIFDRLKVSISATWVSLSTETKQLTNNLYDSFAQFWNTTLIFMETHPLFSGLINPLIKAQFIFHSIFRAIRQTIVELSTIISSWVLFENIEQQFPIISKLLHEIKTNIINIFSTFSSTLSTIFGQIIVPSSLFDTIETMLQNIINFFMSNIIAALQSISKAITLDNIIQQWQHLTFAIHTFVASFAAQINLERFANIWKNLLQIFNNIKNIITQLSSHFNNTSSILALLGTILGTVLNTIIAVIEGLTWLFVKITGGNKIIGYIITTLYSLIVTIIKFPSQIQSAWQTFNQIISTNMTAVITTIITAWQTLNHIISTNITIVTTAITKSITAIKNWVSLFELLVIILIKHVKNFAQYIQFTYRTLQQVINAISDKSLFAPFIKAKQQFIELFKILADPSVKSFDIFRNILMTIAEIETLDFAVSLSDQIQLFSNAIMQTIRHLQQLWFLLQGIVTQFGVMFNAIASSSTQFEKFQIIQAALQTIFEYLFRITNAKFLFLFGQDIYNVISGLKNILIPLAQMHPLLQNILTTITPIGNLILSVGQKIQAMFAKPLVSAVSLFNAALQQLPKSLRIFPESFLPLETIIEQTSGFSQYFTTWYQGVQKNSQRLIELFQTGDKQTYIESFQKDLIPFSNGIREVSSVIHELLVPIYAVLDAFTAWFDVLNHQLPLNEAVLISFLSVSKMLGAPFKIFAAILDILNIELQRLQHIWENHPLLIGGTKVLQNLLMPLNLLVALSNNWTQVLQKNRTVQDALWYSMTLGILHILTPLKNLIDTTVALAKHLYDAMKMLMFINEIGNILNEMMIRLSATDGTLKDVIKNLAIMFRDLLGLIKFSVDTILTSIENIKTTSLQINKLLSIGGWELLNNVIKENIKLFTYLEKAILLTQELFTSFIASFDSIAYYLSYLSLNEGIIKNFIHLHNAIKALAFWWNILSKNIRQDLWENATNAAKTYWNILMMISKAAQAQWFNKLLIVLIPQFDELTQRINIFKQQFTTIFNTIKQWILATLQPFSLLKSAIDTVTAAIEWFGDVAYGHSVFPETIHWIDQTVRHVAWFDRNIKHAVGVLGKISLTLVEWWKSIAIFLGIRDALRGLNEEIKTFTGIDLQKQFASFGIVAPEFSIKGITDWINNLASLLSSLIDTVIGKIQNTILRELAVVFGDYLKFQIDTYRVVLTGAAETIGRLFAGDIIGAVQTALNTLGTLIQFYVQQYTVPLQSFLPKVAKQTDRLAQSVRDLINSLGTEFFQFFTELQPTFDEFVGSTLGGIATIAEGLVAFSTHLSEILTTFTQTWTHLFSGNFSGTLTEFTKLVVEIWESLIDVLVAMFDGILPQLSASLLRAGHGIGQTVQQVVDILATTIDWSRFESIAAGLLNIVNNLVDTLTHQGLDFWVFKEPFSLLEVLTWLISQAVNGFLLLIDTIVTGFENISTYLSATAWIGAYEELSAYLQDISEYYTNARLSGASFFEAVWAAAGPIKNFAGFLYFNIIDPVLTIITLLTGAGGIMQAVKRITKVFDKTGMTTALKGFLKETDNISTTVKRVGDTTTTMTRQVRDGIETVVNKTTEFTKKGIDIDSWTKDIYEDQWDNYLDLFEEFGEAGYEAWLKLANQLDQGLAEVREGFIRNIGDYGKTTQTIMGDMMKDEFKDVYVKLTKELKEDLGLAITETTEYLTKEGFDRIGSQAVRFSQNLQGVFKALIPTFQGVASEIWLILKELAQNFLIFKSLWKNIQNTTSQLRSMFVTLGPLQSVIYLFSKLTKNIQLAWESTKIWGEVFRNFPFMTIKTFFGLIITKLYTILAILTKFQTANLIFSTLWNFIEKVTAKLETLEQKFWNIIKALFGIEDVGWKHSVFPDMVAWIEKTAESFMPLSNVITKATNLLQQLFDSNLAQAFQGRLSNIRTWLSETFASFQLSPQLAFAGNFPNVQAQASNMMSSMLDYGQHLPFADTLSNIYDHTVASITQKASLADTMVQQLQSGNFVAALQSAVSLIFDFITGRIQLVAQLLDELFPGLAGNVQQIRNIFSNAFGEIIQNLANIIVMIDWQPILNTATQALHGIVQATVTLSAQLVEVAQYFTEIFTSFSRGDITEMWHVIDETVNTTFQSVGTFFANLLKQWFPNASVSIDKIFTSLGRLANTVIDTIRGVVNSLIEHFEPFMGYIADFLDHLSQGDFLSAIESGLQAIKEAGLAMVDAIADAIQDLNPQLAVALNNFDASNFPQLQKSLSDVFVLAITGGTKRGLDSLERWLIDNPILQFFQDMGNILIWIGKGVLFIVDGWKKLYLFIRYMPALLAEIWEWIKRIPLEIRNAWIEFKHGGSITALITRPLGVLYEAAKMFVVYIVRPIMTFIAAVAAFFTGGASVGLLGTLQGAAAAALSLVKNLSLNWFIKKLFSLGDVFGKVFGGILNWIGKILNPINWVKKGIQGITKALQWLGIVAYERSVLPEMTKWGEKVSQTYHDMNEAVILVGRGMTTHIGNGLDRLIRKTEEFAEIDIKSTDLSKFEKSYETTARNLAGELQQLRAENVNLFEQSQQLQDAYQIVYKNTLRMSEDANISLKNTIQESRYLAEELYQGDILRAGGIQQASNAASVHVTLTNESQREAVNALKLMVNDMQETLEQNPLELVSQEHLYQVTRQAEALETNYQSLKYAVFKYSATEKHLFQENATLHKQAQQALNEINKEYIQAYNNTSIWQTLTGRDSANHLEASQKAKEAYVQLSLAVEQARKESELDQIQRQQAIQYARQYSEAEYQYQQQRIRFEQVAQQRAVDTAFQYQAQADKVVAAEKRKQAELEHSQYLAQQYAQATNEIQQINRNAVNEWGLTLQDIKQNLADFEKTNDKLLQRAPELQTEFQQVYKNLNQELMQLFLQPGTFAEILSGEYLSKTKEAEKHIQTGYLNLQQHARNLRQQSVRVELDQIQEDSLRAASGWKTVLSDTFQKTGEDLQRGFAWAAMLDPLEIPATVTIDGQKTTQGLLETLQPFRSQYQEIFALSPELREQYAGLWRELADTQDKNLAATQQQQQAVQALIRTTYELQHAESARTLEIERVAELQHRHALAQEQYYEKNQGLAQLDIDTIKQQIQAQRGIVFRVKIGMDASEAQKAINQLERRLQPLIHTNDEVNRRFEVLQFQVTQAALSGSKMTQSFDQDFKGLMSKLDTYNIQFGQKLKPAMLQATIDQTMFALQKFKTANHDLIMGNRDLGIAYIQLFSKLGEAADKTQRPTAEVNQQVLGFIRNTQLAGGTVSEVFANLNTATNQFSMESVSTGLDEMNRHLDIASQSIETLGIDALALDTKDIKAEMDALAITIKEQTSAGFEHLSDTAFESILSIQEQLTQLQDYATLPIEVRIQYNIDKLQQQGNEVVSILSYHNEAFKGTMAYGYDLFNQDETIDAVKAITAEINNMDLTQGTQRAEDYVIQVEKLLTQLQSTSGKTTDQMREDAGLAYQITQELEQATNRLLNNEKQKFQGLDQATLAWIATQGNVKSTLRQNGLEFTEYTQVALDQIAVEQQRNQTLQMVTDTLKVQHAQQTQNQTVLNGLAETTKAWIYETSEGRTMLASLGITLDTTTESQYANAAAMQEVTKATQEQIETLNKAEKATRAYQSEFSSVISGLSQEAQEWIFSQTNIANSLRSVGLVYDDETAKLFEQAKAEYEIKTAIDEKKSALEALAKPLETTVAQTEQLTDATQQVTSAMHTMATETTSSIEQMASQTTTVTKQFVHLANTTNAQTQNIQTAYDTTTQAVQQHNAMAEESLEQLATTEKRLFQQTAQTSGFNDTHAIQQLINAIHDLRNAIQNMHISSNTIKLDEPTQRFGKAYHSGGLATDEVPAILQTGEYVLSRAHIQRIKQNPSLVQMLRGLGIVLHTGGYVPTYHTGGYTDYEPQFTDVPVITLNPKIGADLDSAKRQLNDIRTITNDIQDNAIITLDNASFKKAYQNLENNAFVLDAKRGHTLDDALKKAKELNKTWGGNPWQTGTAEAYMFDEYQQGRYVDIPDFQNALLHNTQALKQNTSAFNINIVGSETPTITHDVIQQSAKNAIAELEKQIQTITTKKSLFPLLQPATQWNTTTEKQTATIASFGGLSQAETGLHQFGIATSNATEQISETLHRFSAQTFKSQPIQNNRIVSERPVSGGLAIKNEQHFNISKEPDDKKLGTIIKKRTEEALEHVATSVQHQLLL